MRNMANGDLELELTTTAEPELLAWVRSFGTEAELISGTSASPTSTLFDSKVRGQGEALER